jgi:hypothetical protein
MLALQARSQVPDILPSLNLSLVDLFGTITASYRDEQDGDDSEISHDEELSCGLNMGLLSTC